ncbi:hypothetical protein [Uliginosibacterium flavum]|uniref:Uncharacterized protein n=1 Tax=Uliginosibacterium flavum TaxID=1396831 RepID=A0ABV2TQF7_9RHOO
MNRIEARPVRSALRGIFKKHQAIDLKTKNKTNENGTQAALIYVK